MAGDLEVDATRRDAGVPSGLDALRALVQRKVHRPPVTIAVPERPGWKLRFDANIPADLEESWQRGASTADGVNLLRAALLALAQQHEAIIDPTGVEMTDEGVLLTFRSQQMWEMCGVSQSIDAVRGFFGVDPHCIEAARHLQRAAGWFDELEADPTPGSSTPS